MDLEQKIANIANKIGRIHFRKIHADIEAKGEKCNLLLTLRSLDKTIDGYNAICIDQYLTTKGEKYLISRIQKYIPHKITEICGNFCYWKKLIKTSGRRCYWKTDRKHMKTDIIIKTKKAIYHCVGCGTKDLSVSYEQRPTQEELNTKFLANIWEEVDEYFVNSKE